MRVVLDTSAIIYLNDFRNFDEMFVVDDVVKEVKDRTSEMKLSGLKFKVAEPSEEAVNEIKHVAEKTGDLEKLSVTDIKVLALAKDTTSTIISDDRNIQNVAEKLGIKYISIFSKKITKLITWKNYCKNCKKFFEKKVCPVCGSELVRVPEKAVKLN
jgi:UPF0271 protein